jgi:hypothetical protein
MHSLWSTRRGFARATAFAIPIVLLACGDSKTHALKDAGVADAADAAVDVDSGTPLVDAGTPVVDSGPVEIDAGDDDAGPVDVDAGDEDAGFDAGPEELDAGHDAGPLLWPDGGACPTPPTFNTACDTNDPSTCQDGLCILNFCVGAHGDTSVWGRCGDGTCDSCEDGTICPADCATPVVPVGTKVYDDPNTITVWVHGFTPHSSAEQMNMKYGEVKGCSDLGDAVAEYGINRPCATNGMDTTPDQIIGVEYYGANPADWMTAQDAADVAQYPYMGGTVGLQRYGLVVGKFIRWRLSVTGATHVNLACHSMGCLISRYVIENDIEHLASTNKIVRWATNAGVVGGARLARLYNNPTVEPLSDAIGLSVDDFAAMTPENVAQFAAAYDHKLYSMDNPLFTGMLIHNLGGTDPTVQASGFNIPLLDILPSMNTGNEPNDGIMFTEDEYFHDSAPAVRLTTPGGMVMTPTHSYIHTYHMEVPSQPGAKALMVAGLFQKRKVIITLESVQLQKDFEQHAGDITTLLQTGTPPADVVAETTIDYKPFTHATTIVDEDKIAYRSPLLFEQDQGTTLMPNQVLFSGPVFDAQTALHLTTVLTETDSYARWGIAEGLLGNISDTAIVSIDKDVPLTDHTETATNANATITVKVQVVDMY